MLAGLALTASAFALTAVSVLEDAAAKRLASILPAGGNTEDAQLQKKLNQRHEDAALRLSTAKASVLGAGPKLIAGMFFFIGGLVISLGLDSLGDQALIAAQEAEQQYGTAIIIIETSETVGAGAMLMAGFGLLMAGAAGLNAAFKAMR